MDSLVLHTVVLPALDMLPAEMASDEATVTLLAIGLQESRLKFRAQVLDGGAKGPARGLWQFERGGGVKGVLTHPATAGHALHVCDVRKVAPTPMAVWQALETDDLLAAGFARLLLYSDPQMLPAVGDEEAAWQLYLRTWRPGAFARQPEELRRKWTGNYVKAMDAVNPA